MGPAAVSTRGEQAEDEPPPGDPPARPQHSPAAAPPPLRLPWQRPARHRGAPAPLGTCHRARPTPLYPPPGAVPVTPPPARAGTSSGGACPDSITCSAPVESRKSPR